jgi:hypothetical protein
MAVRRMILRTAIFILLPLASTGLMTDGSRENLLPIKNLQILISYSTP